MAITLTDAMIDAAHGQLPGVMNRQRIRAALEAALALVPDGAGVVEVPVTARVLVHVDPEQMREQLANAVLGWHGRQPADPSGRMLIATFDAAIPAPAEPHVTDHGLEGPGVSDATGSTVKVPVRRPRPKGTAASRSILGTDGF